MERDLLVVAICLLGSGFFSASETALASLPITRLEALRTTGSRPVRAGLDRWATAPREFLITILVGNNLVNVVASALASRIAYRLTGEGALALAIGVMTLAILIVGEITPKTLAQQNAEWVAVHVAPILYGLDVMLRPVNHVLGLLTRLLTRNSEAEVPVTEQDLLFMLRLAHRHAQLPPDARLMIESVLRFQQAVAREVMVPRPQVVTLDCNWDHEQALEKARASGHSRFPLVDGSPDEIIGVVHAKDLLQSKPSGHWTDVAVPALFIPENKALPGLLKTLRTTGHHLAVVLDEFAGFEGIVTLEDAIEIVVGEIRDEFDRERFPDLYAVKGGYSVAGHVTLRRLERTLHRTLESVESIDSVGGLAASLLQTEARVGDEVVWNRLRITVTEVAEGRPARLLVAPG